jgi:hypothetical protein
MLSKIAICSVQRARYSARVARVDGDGYMSSFLRLNWMAGVIAAGFFGSIPQTVLAETMHLACHGHDPVVVNFGIAIEYQTSTVDWADDQGRRSAYHAQISVEAIMWKTPRRDRWVVDKTTLRLTGTPMAPPTGACLIHAN